ncbi:MAG: MarR family transcriptional regulator [Chloroflexota bacterium]
MEPSTSLNTKAELQADVIAMQQIVLCMGWLSQRRLARELENFHITLPQFMALRAIRLHAQGCTMTALAEASHQVSATMTGIIDRLVDQELVERQRDSADRRTQRVFLTAKGERLLQDIDHQQRLRMQYAIQNLSPSERRQMLQLMERYLEFAQVELEGLESSHLPRESNR